MRLVSPGLIVLAAVLVLLPTAARAQQPPPDSTSLVFEREVFNYPTLERRDPFVTVVSGSEGGPRFEELELIGIIFSPNPDLSVVLFGPRGTGEGGSRARRTFRARRGDQLGNVRILEIQQTRVVVETEDFGLTDQRIMELPRPGEGGSP